MIFNKKVIIALGLPLLGALFLAVYLGMGYNPIGGLAFFVNERTDPFLFVTLMLILPIFGFPISIFLVLCGIKFSVGWAVLLCAASMGLHLLAVLFLTNSLLRQPLQALLSKTGRRLPKLDGNKGLFYTFLFVAIPGPPYFVKNYLMAISRTPKLIYFIIGGGVQFLMALPLVGIGGSLVQMNMKLLIVFGLMAMGVYVAGRWTIRKAKVDD